MTTADTALPQHDDTRAKRNVWVLVAAQAVLGAQLPMIFVIAGLAGQSIGWEPWMATAPMFFIVIGPMTMAPWLSRLMQRRGRRFGFVVGALAGTVGALVAAWGLQIGSFALLLLGSFITGLYLAAHGFYRFAATDTASEAYRPKAISYVMAGGLLAALIGPQLVKVTDEALIVPFVGTYLAVAALNLLGMLLFIFLDIPTPEAPAKDAPKGRDWRGFLADPVIRVAIICAMVSYALMNLVMTSTPLAVVGCGFTVGNASDVVSAHVIAMYAPSFFTGHLIARFGTTRIITAGLISLMTAGAMALAGIELWNFFGALILLGIGWNFGFIGATAMLANAHTPEERGAVQGLNDAMVYGLVATASLSSGVLLNLGETEAAGWTAVNIAMVPFLTLAGGALIWLRLRPSAA